MTKQKSNRMLINQKTNFNRVRVGTKALLLKNGVQFRQLSEVTKVTDTMFVVDDIYYFDKQGKAKGNTCEITIFTKQEVKDFEQNLEKRQLMINVRDYNLNKLSLSELRKINNILIKTREV